MADLDAIAALLTRQIELLTEIRDVLAAPTTDDVACPHPTDRRIEMSAMGEIEWECRDCGYHYGPVKRVSAQSG